MQNINGVQKKASLTAMDAVYSRAMAYKIYKGKRWGPDYLAENFLSSELANNLNNPSILQKEIELKQLRGIFGFTTARTMYYDQVFTQNLSENIPQIVFLGAGYDSRAYRFQELISETIIFELDIKTTQERKMRCLNEAGIQIPKNVQIVPIDFQKDSLKEILLSAGFNQNKKTLFIWEGVTEFLTPEAVDDTLDFVKSNTPSGSLISFDYIHVSRKNLLEYGVMEFIKFMKSDRLGEPSRFRVKQGKIELFLQHKGFEMVDHYTPKELEQKFLKIPDGVLIGRITAIFFIVQAAVK